MMNSTTWRRAAAHLAAIAIPFATLLGAAAPASATDSACDAVPGNVVTNCGFETGDFSGWQLTQEAADVGFTVVAMSPDPNSGNYLSLSGPIGVATLTQTLSTTPGRIYDVSYAVMGGSTNQTESQRAVFSAAVDGQTVGTVSGEFLFSWQEQTSRITATGSATTITFTFHNPPSFWHLDDVVVAPIADPLTKADCIANGGPAYGFANQGQCIRFVENGRDSR